MHMHMHKRMRSWPQRVNTMIAPCHVLPCAYQRISMHMHMHTRMRSWPQRDNTMIAPRATSYLAQAAGSDAAVGHLLVRSSQSECRNSYIESPGMLAESGKAVKRATLGSCLAHCSHARIRQHAAPACCYPATVHTLDCGTVTCTTQP